MSVQQARRKSRDSRVPLDDSFGMYLRDIGRIPLLTRDQEQKLGRRIRRDDEEAVLHGCGPVGKSGLDSPGGSVTQDGRAEAVAIDVPTVQWRAEQAPAVPRRIVCAGGCARLWAIDPRRP